MIVSKEDKAKISEKMKFTKETLITSEISYRHLFETAKNGIMVLDAETGKIINANPFLMEMLGYEKDQLIEKVIWNMGLFKDIIPSRDNFLKLQQKEYVRIADLTLQTAHGQQIHVEFIINAFLIDHHKLIRCDIRDITELKRADMEKSERAAELIIANKELAYQNREKAERAAELIIANKELAYQNQEKAKNIIINKKNEEELKLIKERLLEAQKIAHIGNWEFDVNERKLIWSDELFNILGYKPQEYQPDLNIFERYIYSEDRLFYLELRMKMGKGENVEGEYRIVRTDNKLIWIHEKSDCKFDEFRKINKIYGISQDITEMKLKETEIRESEKKYKSLTDNLPVGIVSYDTSGNIKYVNPKTIEIWGSLSLKDILSVNLFEFPELVKYGISHDFRKCIDTGEMFTVEKSYKTKLGKLV